MRRGPRSGSGPPAGGAPGAATPTRRGRPARVAARRAPRCGRAGRSRAVPGVGARGRLGRAHDAEHAATGLAAAALLAQRVGQRPLAATRAGQRGLHHGVAHVPEAQRHRRRQLAVAAVELGLEDLPQRGAQAGHRGDDRRRRRRAGQPRGPHGQVRGLAAGRERLQVVVGADGGQDARAQAGRVARELHRGQVGDRRQRPRGDEGQEPRLGRGLAVRQCGRRDVRDGSRASPAVEALGHVAHGYQPGPMASTRPDHRPTPGADRPPGRGATNGQGGPAPGAPRRRPPAGGARPRAGPGRRQPR